MIGVLIAQIHDEARRIWCFKWLAFLVAGLVVAAGTPVVMRLPKVYEAWAQIYVAKETPLGSAAQGVSLVGQAYGDPYVVEKTLLNDESLETLLHRLDPATLTLTKGQTALAVRALKSKIRVAPSVDDGFFELHVLDGDPVRARDTVQWLIDEFLNRNLSRNQEALETASRFLDEQIATYRQMLAQSDVRQQSFRAQHPGLAPSSPELTMPVFDGQNAAQSAGGPALRPSSAAQLGPADERVAALDARLSALRIEYTDQHPDVVAVRRQLSAAQAQRAQLALSTPSTGVSTRPRRQLSVARRPRAAAAVSPATKAAWDDLNRTDLTLRANHEQLVARREAARMSKAAYGDGAGKYQVTRAPTVPQLPVGPNRRLYLAALVALAGVSGLASAFVYAAMKGIFVSPRELELALGLPVVGTVSWEPAWSTKPSNKGPGGRGSLRAGKVDWDQKLSLPHTPPPAPVSWSGP